MKQSHPARVGTLMLREVVSHLLMKDKSGACVLQGNYTIYGYHNEPGKTNQLSVYLTPGTLSVFHTLDHQSVQIILRSESFALV